MEGNPRLEEDMPEKEDSDDQASDDSSGELSSEGEE